MDKLAAYLPQAESALWEYCGSLHLLDVFTSVLGISAVAVGIVLAAANFVIPAILCTGVGIGIALKGFGLLKMAIVRMSNLLLSRSVVDHNPSY